MSIGSTQARPRRGQQRARKLNRVGPQNVITWKISIGGNAERSPYSGLMRGSAELESPPRASTAHASQEQRRILSRRCVRTMPVRHRDVHPRRTELKAVHLTRAPRPSLARETQPGAPVAEGDSAGLAL